MAQRDLIYDVGMHNGDDTAYYLSLGSRVVAVEANPQLAQLGRERFARELADGRLTILNVGVAAREGVLPFYVNPRKTDWSSFVRGAAWRDGGDGPVFEVPCRPFASIQAEHGVPHYLKVDIEHHDRECLLGIDAADPPHYVSCEATTVAGPVTLADKGYKRFKLLNQRRHNAPAHRKTNYPFPFGSSGPFGENTPGEWAALDQICYEWLHIRLGHPDRIGSPHLANPEQEAWHDFHARLW